MGYDNPIVGGGGVLIRDSITSRNYDPGVSGWAIFADGFAEFLDVVIRGTLRSTNYVPGVSGWQLDEAGSAEFFDVTARGTFATGAAPGRRVEALDTGTKSVVRFFSGDPTETNPGEITTGQPYSIDLYSPSRTAQPRRTGMILTSGAAGAGGVVTFDQGFPTPASPGTVEMPGMNLDLSGAGSLRSPAMAPTRDQDTTGASTTSTGYVTIGTAACTFTYPRTGRFLVFWSALGFSTSATNGAVLTFEIRDNNAGGTLRRGATDVGATRYGGTAAQAGAGVEICTGMPTSGTGYAYPRGRSTSAAATATFDNIVIWVLPLP